MPLSRDDVKKLLALDQAKPKRGGGRKTKVVERTFEGWFSLFHKMKDDNNPLEPMYCDNPNCQDPRIPPGAEHKTPQMCAEVNGKNMCRYCFLDGWLAQEDEAQTTLEV